VKERHVAWGATLAVFNDIARASAFVNDLLKSGLGAEMIEGKTSSQLRERIRLRLESGVTQIVACVGCWNEGIDLPCLQTVLFADLRHSEVNKRQLAQRASRTHPEKPYYQIVFPVQEDLEDLGEILRGFADDDPCFRASAVRARNPSMPTDCRLVVEEQASLEGETLLSRVGELIYGAPIPSVAQKVAWMSEFCQASKPTRNQIIPVTFNGGVFQFRAGEFCYTVCINWIGKKIGTRLSEEQRRCLLQDCPWIAQAVGKLRLVHSVQRYVVSFPSVAQRLEWMAEFCQADKPNRQQIILVTFNKKLFKFKAGAFCHNVCLRWIGKKGIRLDIEQQAWLERVCPWLAQVIEELTLVHSVQRDVVSFPSVAQRLEWMAEFCRASKPTARQIILVTYNGRIYKFHASVFCYNVCNHWIGKEGIQLNQEQRAWLIGACPWIAQTIEEVTQRHLVRAAGGIPSVAQNFEWMIEFCSESKPKRDQIIPVIFNGRAFQFRAGHFCHNACVRWKSNQSVRWNEDQLALLSRLCPWFTQAVKDAVSIPSVAQKLAWFAQNCQARPTRKQIIPVTFDGKDFKFKPGRFWDCVYNSWTGKTASTSLSEEQQTCLERACPWIPQAIDELKRVQTARKPAV
jgi:hypothetical protein